MSRRLLVLIVPLPAPSPPVPPVFCGQSGLIELAADPSRITGAGTHRPVLPSQQTVAFGAYTAALQKFCEVSILGDTATEEFISE